MDQAAKLGVKDCNCAALRHAARRVTNYYDSELATSGLRGTQFAMLSVISQMGEVSVNGVAEKLALDRTTAGQNLRLLKKAGLISVRAAKSDVRKRVISLTSAGRATLNVALPLWRRAQSQFEAANGTAKAAELRAMLLDLKLDAV